MRRGLAGDRQSFGLGLADRLERTGGADVLEVHVRAGAAGTAGGTRFCIRGKGVKTVNGTGNLYVTVEIDVPSKLTRDQQKKLADYEDSVPLKNCDNMSKFSNTVSAVYGRKIDKQ